MRGERNVGRDIGRRVEQFHGYMEPMFRRSRQAGEFCFMVFEEAFTDDSGNVCRSTASASKQPLLVGAPDVFGADDIYSLEALDAEMEAEHPRNRYVQVGFEEDFFFLDLPLESLFQDEADEITATMTGFRSASHNPVTPTSEEHIRDFDPLQKFYFYGEESEAARDIAGIFFEVLGLPTTTRLYVSSHSASGMRWETGEAFE